MSEGSDVRVKRPIPAHDLRPGDYLGTDDNGDVILVRDLSNAEVTAIRENLDLVEVYHAHAEWLRGPKPPAGRRRRGKKGLRVLK